MSTNGSKDDPLQAALAEAESLMSDLGSPTADEDALAAKFSIDDSDGDLTEDVPLTVAEEKAEEGEGSPKDISSDFHPLHANFLQTNPTERDPAAPALAPGTASGSNSGSSTFTSGAVNGNHPLGTSAVTGSVGNRANLAGASPSLMAPMLAPGTAPSTPAPSLDVFKAQTSRFASKVAGMAQRGLSQVASATSGTGLPNAAAFTAFHHTNAAAETTPMPQHLQQQPPPSPLTQSSAPASAATLQPQAMFPVDLDNEQKAALVHAHVGDLLKGERIIMFLSNLLHVSDSTGFSYSHTSQPNIMWCCAMTYYRLILFGTHPITTASCPPGWNAACWPPSDPKPAVLQMPLASMDRVEKSVFTAGATTAVNPTTLMGLLIHGKDNARQLRFTTPSYADTLRAHELLQTYSFPGRRNLGYLFAFESKREDVMASIQEDESGNKTVTLEPARKRFEPLKEFPRLLSLGDADNTKNNGPRPWAIWSTVNQTYQMCMSYPNILVGPASLDDNNPDAQHIIRQCASFRSEQRLPALTWTSGTDGASIWRCAQPKVGLQGNRSSGDELFLKHIMESAASANAMAKEKAHVNLSRSMLMKFTGTTEIQNWVPEAGCGLKILDLRPRSAAMANRAGGYGYEDERFYMGSKLQFCNIGNIHAVRDAYQKLSALCLNSNASDLQWTSAVEDTKWLSMVRLILAASWEAAFWAHVYRLPVLLHCSHGWDRTSQVAVLAQLILDPYYRTREGFSVLVEKDFSSFGHPFHTRCAHGEGRGIDKSTSAANGSGNSDEGQISPIFIQFLDCVYQLVSQFPECFEFNTKYLLLLSEHVYSCRFGNFLCDTERERELVAGIRQRTNSLWDYLDDREDTANSSYSSERSAGVLLMPLPTLLRNVKLWADRHCMHGPKPTYRWLPADVKRPADPQSREQHAPLYTNHQDIGLLFEASSTAATEGTDEAPLSAAVSDESALSQEDEAAFTIDG